MASHVFSKPHDTRMCYWLLLYYCAAVVITVNILLSLQYDIVVTSKENTSGQNGLTFSTLKANAGQNTIAKVQSNLSQSFKGNLTEKVSSPKRNLHVVPRYRTQSKVKPKETDTTHLEEAEKLYYRKRPTKVFPFIHKFLLEEKSLCSPDTFLIILIHSDPKNIEKRQAIRATWGKAAKAGYWPHKTITDKISLGFVVGIPKDHHELLRNESLQHRDIIQGDFIDDYRNMTLKSLLDLRWVDQFCPQAKYLLKSDDDMVINLPYLIEILHNKTLSRSIMGPLCVGSKVIRKGRWGVTKDLYPFTRYPPYEAGSAYVITADLVRELYETAEYVPPFHVDDVYITGVLGKIINVQHAKVFGFAYAITKPPKTCDIIKNKVITGHKMKPKALRIMWRELEAGPLCS